MASQIWPWTSCKNTDYKDPKWKSGASFTLFSGHGSKPSHDSLLWIWINVSFLFFFWQLFYTQRHWTTMPVLSLTFWDHQPEKPLPHTCRPINGPCWLSGNCPKLPRVQGHGLACCHLVHHRCHQHSFVLSWIMIYLIYNYTVYICILYVHRIRYTFSIRILGINSYDLVSYLYWERNPDRILPPCYKYIDQTLGIS